MSEISIGGQAGERFVMSILGYERVSSSDYFDSNWIVSSVSVEQGAFLGACDISMLTGDLSRFAAELVAVLENASRAAHLRTTEGSLALTFKVDNFGRVAFSGSLADMGRPGLVLSFGFSIEPRALEDLRGFLKESLQAFPERNLEGK